MSMRSPGSDADDGSLGVLALAQAGTGATRLALTVEGVDATSTLTPKTFSTAILISVLFASGSTSNVYLFSSRSAVALLRDDRLRSGRRGGLLNGGHLASSALRLRTRWRRPWPTCPRPGPARNASSARRGEDDVVADEDVVGVELVDVRARGRRGTLRRLSARDVVVALDDDEHVAPRVRAPTAPRWRPWSTGRRPSTSALTTWTRPSRARSDRAPRSAAAFIFLGVRCE